MSKAELKVVEDLISMKIAEKSKALMLKEAPENITDEGKWTQAKAQAKKQYGEELGEDKFYSVVNHIYQNMGGEFKKKKSKKTTTNSHECPCGTKLKKDDSKYGVKPGWSKYECDDCGYSRDYRDGAPVYQAIKIASRWYICESGLPLFSLSADDVVKSKRKSFLNIKHGQAIAEQVASKGAYNAVKSWFVDGEGAEIFHPGLKLASAGIDESDYRLIIRDILLNNPYKRSAAKSQISSEWYSSLKQLAKVMDSAEKEGGLEKLTPGYWANKLMPDDEGTEKEGAEYSHYTPGWQKWWEENSPLNYIIPKSKKAMMYLTAGHIVEAQIPMQTDVSVSEPGIEAPSEQPGEMGGEGADALVGEEMGAELTEDKMDHSNIVDAIGDVLATILANSDMLSVEDVVNEIREVFTDDDAMSEFRGKLEEKVEESDNDDIQEDLMSDEPPADQMPGQEGPGPAPQVVAAMKKAEKWEGYARKVWASHEEYRIKNDVLTVEAKSLNEIKIENEELKRINKRLLIERSAKIRAPRAVKLAKKCYEIGELGDAANDDHQRMVIKAKVDELMKLPDDSFLEKEETINNIHSKMLSQKANKVESNGNSLLMPFLPNKPVSQSELASWEHMSKRTGSAKADNEFYDWNRSSGRARW